MTIDAVSGALPDEAHRVTAKPGHLDPLDVGSIIIAILYFGTCVTGGDDPQVLSLGPVHIYSFDVFTVVFGGIALSRMLQSPRLTSLELTVLAILALSTAQFVRSYMLRGLAAGVDFRHDAPTIAGILYFSQLGSRYTRHGLIRLFYYYVGAACLVYFLRAFGLMRTSNFNELEGLVSGYVKYRFVDSDEALGFLTMGVTLLSLRLMPRRGGSGRDSTAAYFLIALSFVLMHRSVWLAAIVMGSVFPFLGRRFGVMTRRTFRRFLIAAASIVAAAVLVVLQSKILESSIAELQSPNSTWSWRVLGWLSLFGELDVSKFFFGWGYATGLGRWVGLAYVQASTHNLFVDQFTRLGIFGLLLYVAMYAQVFMQLYNVARRTKSMEDRRFAVTLMVLTTGHLSYMMAYGMWIPAFLLLGYTLGFLRTRNPAYLDMSILGKRRHMRRKPRIEPPALRSS